VAISDDLKRDLLQNMDPEWVFQKYVVDGPSFFFREIAAVSADDEYALRSDIAKATGTSINDAVIIGSAKLGFSVKTNDFLKFDHKFEQSRNIRDRSDIDIALINSRYFEEITEAIYHLSNHFDHAWIKENWKTNQYYVGDKNLVVEYSKYVTRGWLRPDFMPNSYLRDAAWLSPCTRWSNTLGRRVAVGIYSNWTYLKHYHMDNLLTLRSKIETLELS
jgi:hypothetical protein